MMASDNLSADDHWEMEDPNLLNDPQLLYRACERLPPLARGEGNRDSDIEFWEAVKITRELILDHSIVIEALSKREEFRGSKEAAQAVLENVIRTFEKDCENTTEILKSYEEMPIWDEVVRNKIFSTRAAERVNRWKTTLNAFLEGYLKIRNCIPTESLEENEEGQQFEKEKEGCRQLNILVEELETLLTSLQ